MTTAEKNLRTAIVELDDYDTVKLWNEYATAHDIGDYIHYMDELDECFCDWCVADILRGLKDIDPDDEYFIDNAFCQESFDEPDSYIDYDALFDWISTTEDTHGCDELKDAVEALKAERYDLTDDDLDSLEGMLCTVLSDWLDAYEDKADKVLGTDCDGNEVTYADDVRLARKFYDRVLNDRTTKTDWRLRILTTRLEVELFSEHDHQNLLNDAHNQVQFRDLTEKLPDDTTDWEELVRLFEKHFDCDEPENATWLYCIEEYARRHNIELYD